MRPVAETISILKARAEEHERRMATDPEYRARVEAVEAVEAKQKADEAQVAQEAVWEDRGVPRRLFALLRNPEPREALDVAKGWLTGGRTFLVLSGQRGVGKTVAAAWAVTQRGGLFRKARDIAWLSSFDTDARETVIRCRFLALDDLGTEPLDEKGWALSMLYSVLDARYDAAAPTLVTTNLGMEAFKARYTEKDGGRLLRRLREAGEWVEIGAALGGNP